jgi:hypothetical protein
MESEPLYIIEAKDMLLRALELSYERLSVGGDKAVGIVSLKTGRLPVICYTLRSINPRTKRPL